MVRVYGRAHSSDDGGLTVTDAKMTAMVEKAAEEGAKRALRDVPSQAGFPQSVIWPEQP